MFYLIQIIKINLSNIHMKCSLCLDLIRVKKGVVKFFYYEFNSKTLLLHINLDSLEISNIRMKGILEPWINSNSLDNWNNSITVDNSLFLYWKGVWSLLWLLKSSHLSVRDFAKIKCLFQMIKRKFKKGCNWQMISL